ncbi:uncharacterized protein LOC125220938 [Salvia hispanica]|uniref:uncharacterized protein LOC125220938 n=1 Tax=Salvia hispanica TaxID=49212 RepID=UPI00200957EA|nr:uncharacterized protein LOC125220938 [Salvia hispanica]
MDDLTTRVNNLEERLDQRIDALHQDLTRRFEELIILVRYNQGVGAGVGAGYQRNNINQGGNRRQQRGQQQMEEEDDAEEHDHYQQQRRRGGGDMYKIKAEIPTFNGNANIEGFLDWIYEVETFFEIMNIPPDRRVPLVAYKLKGGAGAWWNRHQEELRLKGENRVRDCAQMKALLKARFLPADYEQLLYLQFHNCVQGNQAVSEYTEEFLRLQVRCNLYENEDQQVARYVNGLNDSIQERLGIQQIWSIDQAQTLALKAERFIKTKVSYKAMSYSRPENISRNLPRREEEKPTPFKGKKTDKGPSSSKTYEKQPSNPIKCYKCREEGHISSNCPRRKFVNTTRRDENDESDEDVDEPENEEAELCEEDGEEIVCVVKRLLCSTIQPEETQRKKIFESKCTAVNGKVCKFVIDSCISENLVSERMVKHLNLETRDHPNPYTIGWLKKGVKIKITKQCWLPLSLGKHYRSNVLCDVIDMDACHVLLGRP